jgi:hypothetical protein
MAPGLDRREGHNPSIEAWKVAGQPDPGEEARAYMLNMEPPES